MNHKDVIVYGKVSDVLFLPYFVARPTFTIDQVQALRVGTEGRRERESSFLDGFPCKYLARNDEVGAWIAC